MGPRLYVGNLPYSSTEEGLKQLFSQVGTVVSVSLPTDRLTGRPRGFGFVEMGNNTEAQEAVRKFNGYLLDDRSIRVEVAKERVARTPGTRPSAKHEIGYGVGGRRVGQRPQDSRGRGMVA